jgi:hypothetical protein
MDDLRRCFADEVPMVTGKHWTDSSEPQKKAYLIGIANVLQVEIAYEAGNPRPTRRVSFRVSPRG